MNHSLSTFMVVIAAFVFVTSGLIVVHSYGNNQGADIYISHLKVGYFGLNEGTNISYPKNLTQNSEFKIVMNIRGNVTSVYATTPGFKTTGWSELNGILLIYAKTPDSPYRGIFAVHVVGNVPFSLIY